MKQSLLALLFLALTIEGVGIFGFRKLSLLILTVVPFSYLLFSLYRGYKINFQNSAGIALVLFVIFAIISVFQTDYRSDSSTFLLLYNAILLVFILCLGSDSRIKNLTVKLIFISSSIFSLWTVFMNTFPIFQLVPPDGYQFTYSTFKSHNHLGDFLTLPVVISFYLLIKDKAKKYLISIVLFLPLIVLSYSRTAYLSLGLTLFAMFIYFWRNRMIKFWSMLGISLVAFFLFFVSMVFIVVKEADYVYLLKPVREVFVNYGNLEDKYFRSKRGEFLNISIEAFKERPIFGSGPGNFFSATIKHITIPNYSTETSTNIFLDILVENGLIGFIIFVAFIFLVARSAYKNVSVFSFLFLLMILSFQTDYTYRIYSYLILFFVICAFVYNPEHE